MTFGLDPGTLDLVARVLLVCMFPFSAIDKVLRWDAALKQASSSILPAGALMVVAGIVVEVVTPICIVFGWFAQPAAWVLLVFCIATALLFHPFWTEGDFWAKGESKARSHFWDFTKNFGLAGGLLLVATGAGFAGHLR